MPQAYLAIIERDPHVIPKQIKEKLGIKKGDLILIQIEKVYGKENMPKDKTIILL